MKATRHTLKKIEQLYKDLEYEVIYEKGNFNSGYCIVEQQKKIVINKFYDVEGRINTLIDILIDLAPDFDHLSDTSVKVLKAIYKQKEDS